MKAGSLPDDDAVALRECRASPSSGEVCLEVCSRYVSLCLHLFFCSIKIVEARSGIEAVGKRVLTLYFELCAWRIQLGSATEGLFYSSPRRGEMFIVWYCSLNRRSSGAHCVWLLRMFWRPGIFRS